MGTLPSWHCESEIYANDGEHCDLLPRVLEVRMWV